VREVTERIDQVCLSLAWMRAGGRLDPETEFEWMFRTEYQPVLRTVMLVVRDIGRAEDITQEAFIQLLGHWRKISRYERPDAWVRRVAIRLAVRAARRERLRPLLERGARGPIEEGAADPDVAYAIAKLSPIQRACVVLYYFEDRPMAEVADIAGVSVTAAKVAVHRARRRLAELIGEEVDEDVR
jgi:RNA polymerase sigma-70 factor (ECF subfamily)